MTEVAFDKEGFLRSLDSWNEHVAEEIAHKEGIELGEEHWQMIWLVRDFHQQFQRSPNMRAFIAFLKQSLDNDEKQKAGSIYLLTLFPQSPVKRLCKIAGLPKPDNCL